MDTPNNKNQIYLIVYDLKLNELKRLFDLIKNLIVYDYTIDIYMQTKLII